MAVHLWLRAEVALTAPSRGNPEAPLETERRTVLSPGDARKLLATGGFRVTVERSGNRVFADADYEAAGCELVPFGAWISAPADAVVLGLRAPSTTPALDRAGFRHRHVYFGHVFKHQRGWQEVIARFVRGGGLLWDLEYLTDEDGHRLVSFGPIAGTMGMAAGLLGWCRQVLASSLGIVMPPDLVARLAHLPLVDHLRGLLQTASATTGRMPRIVIIGANGRVGRGAAAFADKVGLKPTLWTRANTKAAGPFAELLQFDVLINAIKLGDEPMPPFLTHDLIRTDPTRRLSVVVDISCDVASPNNPLPIYSHTTTFGSPSVRVVDEAPSVAPLDVIAIPTLPSLVPELSSRSFSEQLLPHLLTLPFADDSPVWARASTVFRERARPFEPAPLQLAGGVPLSLRQRRILHLQHRLVLDTRDASGSRPVSSQLSKAYRLPSTSNSSETAQRLERRLRGLVDAQPLLRTAFAPPTATGAEWTATVAAGGSAASRPLLHIETQASVSDVVERELRTPLELHSWPLLRTTLVRQGSDSAVLVVSAHEAIMDEPSLDLVVAQLFDTAGTDSAVVQAPRLVYADFASWQLARAQQERSREADEKQNEQQGQAPPEAERLGYWRGVLQGNCHCLQIPTDYPRPPQQTFAASTKVDVLPPRLVASLKELSARLGWVDEPELAVPALLLAAFKLLLFRYSAENDIILGTEVSGRSRAGLASMLGPLAQPLLLRTPLSDDVDFAALFSRVRQTVRGALSHDEVPFETVLDSVLGHEASLASHVPFYQVRFIAAALTASGTAAAAGVVPLPSEQTLAAYDWTLSVDNEDASGAVSVRLAYSAALFSDARIAETLAQLRLLLDQLLVNPSQNVMTYTLVTPRAASVMPDPRQPLDAGWPGPITQIFAENARKQPERVAIVYQDERITYGQLDVFTNRLANRLIAAGVKPAEVVGLYGHRSPAVVWAIMGILKAGAAYTMMDPAYPVSRIVACLDIAKPRAWIQIGAAGEIPADLDTYLSSLGLVCRLVLPPLNSPEAAALLPAAPDADRLPTVSIDIDHTAVVTFTSGSTGVPKGVMGRHGPLTHFYPWMSERFGLNADDRFSMCSGIAHDPLQRDIFTPLFFGAAIYIPTQDDIATPGRLAEWMGEQRVTVSCLTPAMGQLLTSVDVPSFTIPLRAVFFVGDMLIKRDVARLRKLAPQVVCVNMYGSTETQRAVGYFQVPPDDVLARMKEVIPCGAGMRDVHLIILNNANVLCGVGEVGEIYVRSPHLAKGYMGLDATSADKFLVNRFTGLPVDRMYRTGDLGRYMADGVAECIGRADDQVKIRGFRIELGEINATLSKHPSVKENVTVVRDDGGDKKLVSYIVPTAVDANGRPLASGAAVDAGQLSRELRAFLKAKLPHYMVPAHVVVIHAMPLTPNGKINRQALPPPDPSIERSRPSAAVLPLSATEELLMKIWARVLGCEVNSVDDNFFDLGGHSLVATRLTFEINKALSIQLPMQLLFSAPTVASLAAAVDLLRASGGNLPQATASIDLEKEVQLDASITAAAPTGGLAPASEHLRHVLLTGATGFLGAFILRDLLQHTDAIVHCLVRAPSAEDAFDRVQKSLRVCLLWDDSYATRIVAEPGDLAKPRLGLSPTDFDRLASLVDAIVHNGAYVHWLLPYGKLKPTNVGSTQEVLRLATTTRLKPVHHVSTTSVYGDAVHRQQAEVLEGDALASWQGLSGGYPQSKWVADRIALLARSRGVPVNVYRPGYISGDSVHGVWNTDDFLCRLIKGCVQLGCAPDIDDPRAALDMCPVDYVSAAIVSGVVQPQFRNTSFNLVNPHVYRYNRLFAQVASFGYAIDIVPYREWRALLQQASTTSTTTAGAEATANDGSGQLQRQEANALSAVLAHFSDGWAGGLANPRYDCRNTLAALAAGRVQAPLPEMDSLVITYTAYLAKVGFLPPPPSSASDRLSIDWRRIGEGVTLMAMSRSNRS